MGYEIWSNQMELHFAERRRGRCLAEIARMMSRDLPALANGGRALAVAASRSLTTPGRLRVAADSRRRKRVCLPDPWSRRSGSGSTAPRRKQRPTPFAAAAIEIMLSEGRSVGENPITKKL